jgi:hypothetical protein
MYCTRAGRPCSTCGTVTPGTKGRRELGNLKLEDELEIYLKNNLILAPWQENEWFNKQPDRMVHIKKEKKHSGRINIQLEIST